MLQGINLASAKVLVVDDVVANREFLEKALEQEGYNIAQAPSGEIALELAHRFLPDVILLDIVVKSGADGFDICRRLKADKATREIPVIFISAKGSYEDIQLGFQAGGVDYITKPFKEEEIRARVKTCLTLKLLKEVLNNKDQILEERVKECTKELHETRLEIIHRLGKVSEYSNSINSSHGFRISRYCSLLGHASGMNGTELELLIQTSPIHDIGKVGIPEKILLKPGKLGPGEWETMQRHVSIGTKIFSGSQSKLVNMARTIVQNHHERWDGTGYLEGLKGEEIPLVGRICSLCDAFDALTSDRPYRKAFSFEDAMDKIESLSGKYFDPFLVKLFKQLLRDIKKIRKQFPD